MVASQPLTEGEPASLAAVGLLRTKMRAGLGLQVEVGSPDFAELGVPSVLAGGLPAAPWPAATGTG